LLDILACPADGCKYYPLKLSIFEWERDDEKRISSVAKGYVSGDVKAIKKELKDNVKIDEEKGVIEDELVRKPLDVKKYVDAFKEKIESIFKHITDLTGASSELITDIVNFRAPAKLDEKLENMVYLANWLAFKVNVKSGVLICEKCGRWYPIIETIPHMLPDDLRNKKEDKEFLMEWKDKLPERILKSEGITT